MLKHEDVSNMPVVSMLWILVLDKHSFAAAN